MPNKLNPNDTYKLKGVTDDNVPCENCGKTKLKKVVWLVLIDPETNDELNEAFPVGTTCAAKLLGVKKHWNKKIVSSKIEEIANKQVSAKFDEIFNDRSKVGIVSINTYSGGAYILAGDIKDFMKGQLTLPEAKARLRKAYPISDSLGGPTQKTALELLQYT